VSVSAHDEIELNAAEGAVAPELRAEFPGLRLLWLTVASGLRPSTREVKRRLRELSSRYRGEHVVAMRTQPIPHAYRVFYRQIGLDPDTTRVPSEAAAVDRLMHGGFRSRNLIDDACLIALIETGVPVSALDADRLDVGGLGIRLTVAGDRLGSGEYASELPSGRLAVTDAERVHALLFEPVAPAHRVSRRTEHVALFAIGVDGVPAIHLEEALWIAVEAARSGS
jgi:DNA/RNA-binding domain of Phe-tRNA-synthetase-like protein